MKEVKFQSTYNGTIIVLKFNSKPVKGWWKENIQPQIDLLKALIPGTQRQYDPVTHYWSIAVEYWTPMRAILEGSGFNVIEVSSLDTSSTHANVNVPKDYAENFYQNNSSAPLSTKDDPALIAKSLSKYLGTNVSTMDVISLKRLYRQKARELHPDLNPNPSAASEMAELNRLWTIFNSTHIN